MYFYWHRNDCFLIRFTVQCLCCNSPYTFVNFKMKSMCYYDIQESTWSGANVPSDDYVYVDWSQWTTTFCLINVSGCSTYSSVHCRRFLLQQLVCGTVFHRTSLLPALSIFYCRLKSHLFSLSYPAFCTVDERILWLSELAMREWMNMGLSCRRQKCGYFTAYEVCTNFRHRVQKGRRTGVEPLNLVIIHIMQYHLSDILICVVVCNVYYYESS